MTVVSPAGGATGSAAPPVGAPAPAAPRRRRRLGRSAVPWLILVPGLVFALYFKLIPMVEGFRISVFDVRPFLGDLFVGFDNFARVLGDQRFIDAMWHTLALAAGTTLGAIVLGILLALLLEGSSKTLAVVRTAVFLPVVTAIAVIGEIWRILYFPSETGFINSVLGLVGIPAQEFLADPATALFWVMVVGIWTTAPYNMVIVLAGLAGIDRTLYEASAVDGASTWTRFRHIVLPGLGAALSIIVTLAAIRGLRIFTEVYVLTGGGPAGATEVWMTRVYSLGFQSNNLGVAAAASVLLLVVTLVLTIGTRLLTARRTG